MTEQHGTSCSVVALLMIFSVARASTLDQLATNRWSAASSRPTDADLRKAGERKFRCNGSVYVGVDKLVKSPGFQPGVRMGIAGSTPVVNSIYCIGSSVGSSTGLKIRVSPVRFWLDAPISCGIEERSSSHGS